MHNELNQLNVLQKKRFWIDECVSVHKQNKTRRGRKNLHQGLDLNDRQVCDFQHANVYQRRQAILQSKSEIQVGKKLEKMNTTNRKLMAIQGHVCHHQGTRNIDHVVTIVAYSLERKVQLQQMQHQFLLNN